MAQGNWKRTKPTDLDASKGMAMLQQALAQRDAALARLATLEAAATEPKKAPAKKASKK
jgi:hypothetical protein